MGRTGVTWLALLGAAAGVLVRGDTPLEPFPAYADSDICARLMVGPITDARTQCSRSTYKDGAEGVLVRLRDNLVLSVNKQKFLQERVGDFVSVTGEVKEKNGRIKVDSIKSIDLGSIPSGSVNKMLDVRQYKVTGEDAKIFEKIRHELAMLPYFSDYDYISFAFLGGEVILSGWTVRDINRGDAEHAAKSVKGVEHVTNNIDVLPLGSMDMTIRANTRLKLQRFLSRYFWGSGSDIKIIIKNGKTILLGQVTTKEDSDVAFIQANSVPGAFKVFNLLRVTGKGK